MSSSNPVQNGQPSENVWSYYAPYLAPPAAASAAIVPVYYGFIAKSAQQMGEPIPRMSPLEAIKRGCQATPKIGATIGVQMLTQDAVEKVLNQYAGNREKPSFFTMLASAAVVGAASAPFLAVFNGDTTGQSVRESLRSFRANPKQGGAIISREISFLFALRISGPVGEVMKQRYGDNQAVQYSSIFMSGAIGSLIGHPADTALTLWQNGRKIENIRHLMRGGPMKAVAVGGFAVGYNMLSGVIDFKTPDKNKE